MTARQVAKGFFQVEDLNFRDIYIKQAMCIILAHTYLIITLNYFKWMLKCILNGFINKLVYVHYRNKRMRLMFVLGICVEHLCL